MDRAHDFADAARVWQARYRRIGFGLRRARPAWIMADLSEDGACGDAAPATAELEVRLLDAAADNFAPFLSEFDHFCREAGPQRQVRET